MKDLRQMECEVQSAEYKNNAFKNNKYLDGVNAWQYFQLTNTI